MRGSYIVLEIGDWKSGTGCPRFAPVCRFEILDVLRYASRRGGVARIDSHQQNTS
jgi:hypothetical protein